MKTIVVPTDFSPTAKNAAVYALKLATDLKADKIVLLNVFQPVAPVVNEPTMPTTTIPVIDAQSMKEISENGLRQFKDDLQSTSTTDIQIDLISEFATLASDIDDICTKAGADLIVMGVTATSKVEELLIGSTAISVVKNTKIPVIVVPPGAKYSAVNKVAFACDLENVVDTTPVLPIKSILNATEATLHVINVYESARDNTSEKTYQQELLHSLLKEYNPVFEYINSTDFVEGVNGFIDTNGIDLLITIPKKHAFFQGLLKESHSKKLAFHSHVPLMCIHHEEL